MPASISSPQRPPQFPYRLTKATKPATVHQEFRVLRRIFNVAVKKKLCPANPCTGVEFPVTLRSLFRPHYMTWSEQQMIENHAPEYLRNVIRIITETGLRVYKELAGMRKDQIDLANKLVFIPDSKTPTGVAEVPLTNIALEAFRSQIEISGPGPWLFPSPKSPSLVLAFGITVTYSVRLREPAVWRQSCPAGCEDRGG
jgi:integrase